MEGDLGRWKFKRKKGRGGKEDERMGKSVDRMEGRRKIGGAPGWRYIKCHTLLSDTYPTGFSVGVTTAHGGIVANRFRPGRTSLWGIISDRGRLLSAPSPGRYQID